MARKIKNVVFVTNSLNFFPQRLDELESINISTISNILTQSSLSVHHISFPILINDGFLSLNVDYSSTIFVFCSSQHPSYFSYIDDVIYGLSRKGVELLPRYDLLRSHENKFFQEIFLREYKVPRPKTILIGSLEDVDVIENSLKFPCVAKLSQGYASVGVEKISSVNELKRYLTDYLTPTVKHRKNFFKYKKTLMRYKDKYPSFTGKVVLQEFLPDLKSDWKVIVIGKKIFTLKRYVRKGDFRASGSGMFDFHAEPDIELIKFAFQLRVDFDTPWVSLDIAETNDGFKLIEFQAIHFGPYTVTNSKKHYMFNNGSFDKIDGSVVYEEELAQAILNYI